MSTLQSCRRWASYRPTSTMMLFSSVHNGLTISDNWWIKEKISFMFLLTSSQLWFFVILLHPLIRAIDPTLSHKNVHVIKADLETHSHGTFPIQSWQERLSASIMGRKEREKVDCCHVCSLMWINILSGRTKLIHEGKGLENGLKVLMTLEPLMLKKFSLSKVWSINSSFECGNEWSSLSGLWLFECGIYPFIMKITPSDGSVGKESACSSGDTEDMCWIPRLGRSPRGGNGNPHQYSCLKNPMDRGVWRVTVTGSQRVRHDLVIK